MKSILTLISFFIFPALMAQTVISGTITSKKNNDPIAGATILISNTYDGGISDADGNFHFQTTVKGEHQLIAKSLGFTAIEKSLSIVQDSIYIHIELAEKFNELKAVSISAGAFEAGDKKKSVALKSIDMATVPGAQGSVVGALQYLPGTSTNGESGKLFVRGGSSSESQTYVDGTLVPIAYNPSAPNTAVRSKFNPFLFDGTVFSTGGFSAEYGQALSSVLLLETKGLQEQDQLDISILSVGLGLAGTKKWKKTALTASFDHTNLTPYISLVPQNIDWVKMPTSNTVGVNFRHKAKKGLFKLYGTYSDSHFSLNRQAFNSTEKTIYNLKNQNEYINASYMRSVGKKWIMKSGIGFTNNIDNTSFNQNKITEKLIASHAKTTFKGQLNDKIKLKTGAELFYTDFKQHIDITDTNVDLDYRNFSGALFVESNIYLSKKLVARIGGRLEKDFDLPKLDIAPRISMAYQISKHGQFSAAIGRFSQSPSNKYKLYNKTLNQEYSNQFMLNYQWRKNKRTLRTEVYYKDYDNLVKFETASPFYSTSYYTNNGNGYAYGLDLFFRDNKTIKNGEYWISYSYLETKRNYLEFPEESTPGYASKHNVSFIYKHWIKKMRSLIGASYNYSSPRNYNDPNKAQFNTESTKAYHSLNLNWSYLYRENIIFYTSATNILGYEQSFGHEFSTVPNSNGVYEKRLITPPAPRFFIIGCFITLSKSGDKNQLDKIQ